MHQRKRSWFAQMRLCGVAAALLVAPMAADGAAELTVDFAAAQRFLGGGDQTPVKARLVFSNGNDLNFVDFDRAPLTIKRIASDGGCEYRSVNISPDGRFVAYAVAKRVYVRVVEENSNRRTEVGDGDTPTWWIHPRTNTWYVLYREPVAEAGKTFIRRFDPSTLQMVDEARVLIDCEQGAPNGGRSADGRFMTADDAIHGTIELDDPLAVEGATVKNWVKYTSYNGWPEPAGGWCNASIGPAASPTSRFYGCVQHLGSNHTDIFIRSWPKDLSDTGPIAPNHVYMPGGDWYQPDAIPAAQDTLVHLRPKDGNSNFHGGFWSTHENYLITKVGRSKNDGSWAVYIYDVSELDDKSYVQVLSKALNKGNDFAHLWVDPSQGTAVPPGRSQGVAHATRAARLAHRPGSAYVSVPGGARALLQTLNGRTVATAVFGGDATARLDIGMVQAGAYLLCVIDGTGARQIRPVVLTTRR